MLTDVVKSLHGALSVTGKQHALWAKVEDHVIAGFSEVGNMRGSYPAFGPHRLPLASGPVAADIALFGEILDVATIGLLTLLVEWLFGVHVLSPDPATSCGFQSTFSRPSVRGTDAVSKRLGVPWPVGHLPH